MSILSIVSVILFIFGIILLLIIMLFSRNSNLPKKRNEGYSFCIMIPARYESSVIATLLESIKNQSFKINMSDVYVIVESKSDPTVNICKNFGASIVIRKKLDLKTKGYALDEGVKYILSKKKKYTAYFIFDADNILDKDYIKNMIPVFDKGYDLASGYRNAKNGNASSVAASSALTFSLINEVFNRIKCNKTKNITFSGTGFYIRGYLIEKFKGYPFTSLTEDYELSCYATLNDLTTYYNDKSIFYDEQPVKYKNTINQRVRWIKGYFNVRKKYSFKIFKSISKSSNNNGSKIDESIGILPYLFMVLSLCLYFVNLLLNLIISVFIKNYIKGILPIIIFFVVVYILLLILTIILLIIENKKINLNVKTKIKTLFVNPLYIISYIPCALQALFKKDIKWSVVNHGDSK